MKKKREKAECIPQKAFAGFVLGFLLAALAIGLLFGGETLCNYDWAGKWNRTCDLYHCE